MEREWEFETRAVHAGTRVEMEFLPTAPSIHPSTTFTYPTSRATHEALDAASAGFAYSRNANPTVRLLEEGVASLEETEDAVAFASGMAALHASVLASGLRPGDTILAARDLYGVSRTLLTGLFQELGFKAELVDATDREAVEKGLASTGARLICFEPISNPLLRVVDVAAVINRAHAAGALVIVDNTFATPYLIQPSKLGADIVLHSASKYLGGHGDVIAGVAAGSTETCRRLRQVRTATGGTLGPFEAWLVLRGLRTLSLRVRAQCRSAATLASMMTSHRAVERVHFPGLDAKATAQFRDGLGGGMVALETPLSLDQVEAMFDRLRVAVPGTSLGDTGTLVLAPALSSHRTLTAEERKAAGIADGLVRVSVGLESVTDIARDLSQALDSVYTPVAT